MKETSMAEMKMALLSEGGRKVVSVQNSAEF
jgi:hypothetical protein